MDQPEPSTTSSYTPSNPWPSVTGNAVLILACLYWVHAILTPHAPDEPPWTYLDYANLIFHEAGHWIFVFFDNFMHVLGGSLTQLLVPGIVLAAFARQGSWFASAFSLFWLGESLTNISWYAADAREMALPLIGNDPEGHDWHYLLTQLHWLSYDTVIGHLLFGVGVLAMLAGIAWMAYRTYLTATGWEETPQI